ncbi:hypothetical protein HUW51_18910 [Adhaeribacter swui]|uniref:Uncharacterized protein n=1 Tax=Adhaeribacter swui TaxID=2086471 RepID=A0A7G7GC12_9BACT|nr:hypothetical protein [Adhaeribacter swui]QNF34696.1 hypothetical protein HUW51_18910 [Adhaeribacter swui]
MKKTNMHQVGTKAVLFTLLMLVSLMLPSCFLFGDDDEDDPKPAPRSEVPAALAHKWLAGQFSMTEFWKYDGSYSGNAFEMGIAFDFKANGDAEFYMVTGGTSMGCRTESFIYKKGTVLFNNNNSFTFYPTEGRKRGYYRGCAASYDDYDEKYTSKDLKPETYFYTIEKNSNGQDQLVTRFKVTDAAGTYFRVVNW